MAPTFHRVIDVTALPGRAFCLRLSHEHLSFQPGHHIRVGLPGDDAREYSVFSSPSDPTLDILFREVDTGHVSPQLARCRPGDTVCVEGPMGTFLLPSDLARKRFLFVATGTGVAPFYSMVRTIPDLDYRLVHGVRARDERYVHEAFAGERYVSCVSGEAGGDVHGRVTDHLQTVSVEPATECYLCGSCDMIYDVFAILTSKGVPRSQIHVETYY